MIFCEPVRLVVKVKKKKKKLSETALIQLEFLDQER